MPDPAPGGRALAGRVARGGILAFGIHIGGAGLTYCSQMLIARTVGADGFGLYAYVFAWMTLLAYFAALGFDVSLMRFIPAYHAQGAWPMLRGVIQFAQRSAAMVGVAVAVLGICLVRLLPAGDVGRAASADLADTFVAGFFLVPVLALLWIRSSIVRSFGGVVSALAPDRMIRDGLLLGFMGVAALVPQWRIDAPTAMLATLLSAALGLAIVSLAMRRWTPAAAYAAAPQSAGRIWAKAALPLVVIAVADVAINRTGVVLLGWAGMTTDAGIYALAFNIAFLVALPRTAINALFAPAISGLFVRKDIVGLQALATRTAVWTLLGAACIALPLALLAHPLLGWFGQAFTQGVSALRLLLFGQVISAAAGSQLYLLTMTGHERSAAALMLLNAVVNAVLGAVLIRFLGLEGAAIATTTTLILWNAAMALLVWRLLHIVPSALAILATPFPVKPRTIRAPSA